MSTTQPTFPITLQNWLAPLEGSLGRDFQLSTTALVTAALLMCVNGPQAGVVPAIEPHPLNDAGGDLTLPEVVSKLEKRLYGEDKKKAHRLGRLVIGLSRQHRISAALILAVIETESGFRPSAISKAGAVGLMQLRPQTAKEIASRHHIPGYTDEKSLEDPDVNIRIGVAYLALLRRQFKHSTHYLAAYNVGPAAFRKRFLQAGRHDLGSLGDYVRQVHRRAQILQNREADAIPAWRHVAGAASL